MTKKKRQQQFFSPLFTVFIGLTILSFIGLAIAFNTVLGVVTFADEQQPEDLIARINPDMTQVPQTTTAITPDDGINPETFEAILRAINVERGRQGLPAVRYNSVLHQAAAQQASYNAIIRTVTHDDAEGTGVDARVDALGYQWSTVAENLLSNWTLNGHVIYMQWHNSQGHYDNMVNEQITEIGLAYHVTSYGQVYFAMVLARPR